MANTVSEASPSPSKRGRPADPTLRPRILEAAKHEFMLSGLAGASLSSVARAAGCSRVTLYGHFPTKETLFQAVLTRPVLERFRAATADLQGLSAREALLALAQGYLLAVQDPEAIAQIHLLYRNSLTSGSIAPDFYAEGPQAITEDVVQVLKRLSEDGVVQIPNLSMAAEQFIAMVRGNDQMRALLSLPPAHTPQSKSRYLDLCVEVFLRGYAKPLGQLSKTKSC